MALYWPGAIVQYRSSLKADDWFTTDCCGSLDEALKDIDFFAENYGDLLTAWITIDEEGKKKRVIWVKERVKACPFCGGEAEFKTDKAEDGTPRFCVECEDCGSRTDYFGSFAAALERWQRRG